MSGFTSGRASVTHESEYFSVSPALTTDGERQSVSYQQPRVIGYLLHGVALAWLVQERF